MMPNTKVSTAALAGAIVVIVGWAVQYFFGVDIPGEVHAAAAVVIGALLAYLVPEKNPAPSDYAATRRER